MNIYLEKFIIFNYGKVFFLYLEIFIIIFMYDLDYFV